MSPKRGTIGHQGTFEDLHPAQQSLFRDDSNDLV